MSTNRIQKINLDFSVLVYREDGFWIAHCLETDLAAEGDSAKVAIDSLIDLSNSLIEDAMAEGNLESIFSPAPSRYWQMYSTASENKNAAKKPSKAAKPINRLNVRKMALA